MKTHLEATNRRYEVLMKQLQEKERKCEKLKSEIVTLKEDYEKTKSQSDWNKKWVKASESLENIINEQLYPLIKIGVGHNNSNPKDNEKD